MRLYLVQHGEAVPKDVDPNRPLSEQGMADVERIATFLKGRTNVVRVVHSGKTRAQETAEILAALIAPGKTIEPMSGLDPLDHVEPIAQCVRDWNADTLVVGHLPFMNKLIARLVTGNEEPGIAAYQPGSVVCLERGDDGRWAIAWMLRPELFGS